MRSRSQLRRERTGFLLCALVSVLIVCVGMFGVLALTVTNTGAAMGYAFLCVLSIVTALIITTEAL